MTEEPELAFHRKLLSQRRRIIFLFALGSILITLGILFGLVDVAKAAVVLGGIGALMIAIAIVLQKREPAALERRLAKFAIRIGSIRADEDAIVITQNDRKTVIAWSSIKRLVAYKIDEVTTDLICMAIETTDGKFAIHEEMIGWRTFIEAIDRRLPGATPWEEWWMTTAFPAFAMNPTTIFERDNIRRHDLPHSQMQ